MKNQEDLSFDEKESLDRICGNKTETVGDSIDELVECELHKEFFPNRKPPVAKHSNKKDSTQ
jgi:hypothetical protein